MCAWHIEAAGPLLLVTITVPWQRRTRRPCYKKKNNYMGHFHICHRSFRLRRLSKIVEDR